MSLIDDIKRDREAGTTECEGQEDSAFFTWQEALADQSRRDPDRVTRMEAALLAAEAALEEYSRVHIEDDAMALDIENHLAAYRMAKGETS